MQDVFSYDIYVLGLKDPSAGGRHRFASAMERLTGRPSDEFEDHFPSPNLPMFQAMDLESARNAVDALGEVGILVEIRPTDKPPMTQVHERVATRECPACNHIQSAVAEECERCGVVFKKYEREQLLKMQKDHTLEQAMIKAMQVREEWLQRANKYLESKPLNQDSVKDFKLMLVQDELPFLRLESAEGPLLLTSRRILAKDTVGKFVSIPYEMVKEVDFGGGPIQTKKSKARLQLIFHSPLPVPPDETFAKMAWHLDKESMFNKEVVMDWGYARNFICGSCGERDLDYRTEGRKVNCRCMHCATDHEIDLAECIAVPKISE
jgi:hypothetical protein